MTPAALTPAARKTSSPPRTATGPRGSATTRKGGHRSPLRPRVAPRSPRRVSGPLGGLTRGRATTAAPPASTPRQPAPARRPTPARRRARTGLAPSGASLAVRAAAYVRALPEHSLLDRIIRGRVWIPLLGVLLAGIVAMQVEVLKLNAATGVSLQRTTALQNQRDMLQADVARLADDQRIESMAAQMGMQMPAPSQVKFLSTSSAATGAAATHIQAPNATTFLAQLPAAQTTGGVTTGAAPVSAAVTDPTASATATATPNATTPATTTAATSTSAATATGAATPTTPAAPASTATPTTAATPTAPASPTTAAPTGAVSGRSGGGHHHHHLHRRLRSRRWLRSTAASATSSLAFSPC